MINPILLWNWFCISIYTFYRFPHCNAKKKRRNQIKTKKEKKNNGRKIVNAVIYLLLCSFFVYVESGEEIKFFFCSLDFSFVKISESSQEVCCFYLQTEQQNKYFSFAILTIVLYMHCIPFNTRENGKCLYNIMHFHSIGK